MDADKKVIVITLLIRHLKGVVSALEKWAEMEKADAATKR